MTEMSEVCDFFSDFSDFCELNTPLLDGQRSLLGCASRNGPAECFLSRTVSYSVRFEGDVALCVEEWDQTEVAVRVIRAGRYGIWGGAYAPHQMACEQIVSLAEESAKYGPRAQPGFDFVRGALPDKKKQIAPSFTTPKRLVENGCELFAMLLNKRKGFFWSGDLLQKCRVAHIVNSAGLDGWSSWSEYQLRIRAQYASKAGPVDRLLNIQSGCWHEAVSLLETRIDAEFPEAEELIAVPPVRNVTLGAPVVAALCQAIVSGKLPELNQLSQELTIWDEPTFFFEGCDDEGVQVTPIPLVEKGKIVPWGTSTTTDKPVGRAFRRTIEKDPVPTALGLRCLSEGHSLPSCTVLFSELAGISIQPGGYLQGAATEGIVIRDSIPVHRCTGRFIRFPIAEALGDRLLSVSRERRAAGKHRLPYLTLEF